MPSRSPEPADEPFEEPFDAPERPRAWAPKPELVGLAWLLAAAALAFTIFGGKPTGQLLTGVATLALAVLALIGTVARPRLRVDEAGVVVRQLTGQVRWPWATVLIRVTRTRRLGREVALLELDGDAEDGEEHLVVLGRMDVGTDVEEVADVLRDLRPR
jgi:Bacterial PH domain